MNSRDAIRLIECAYRIEGTLDHWLQELAVAGASVWDSSQGAIAFRYDASSGDWVHVDAPCVQGLAPEFVRGFFNQHDAPRDGAIVVADAFRMMRFGSFRCVVDQITVPNDLHAFLDGHGIPDLIGINGLDPSGHGCMLAIAAPWRRPPSRTVHLWHRLATHISAGNRLRATLEALGEGAADPVAHAEAVLSPNGKVEHATGPAEPKVAREALRDALVRIDAARAERDDARRSVELWRGLVSGRWSLVEHFERDGRRYFLAHKNDPEVAGDRALTESERQVLAYAALGYSNKLTSYALGYSASTVATLLGRGRRKVGR